MDNQEHRISELLGSMSQISAGSNIDPAQLSPLVLAYVGDAVYELFVRTSLIESGIGRVNKIHSEAIGMVCAGAQAEILKNLEPDLTDEEKDIVRRGRNAKASSPPRNADVINYRYSTGFEALIGYLFLNGMLDRLMEILRKVKQI